MATNKPRFTITVPEDLYKLIEDYRFENRYSSRSDAVIELIRQGLIKLDEKGQNDNKK